jgi:hypothetical protein
MAKRKCSPTGQPIQKESDGLMRLLECDLEDLERRIGNEAKSILIILEVSNGTNNFLDAHHIALAMASMQLRTYYFFEPSASEMRKQGLLRAYSAALNFISKVVDEDTKSNFVKYMPNVFCQILNTAGMLLMKIINSSYSRYVDIESGKRSFNVILDLLRRATLEDNDIRGRGGKILAQLWTVHQARTIHRGQEPNLRVKSRLGASVLHDGLWIWREEFGGQGSPFSGPSDPFSNLTLLPLSQSPSSIYGQRPLVTSKFTISSLWLTFWANIVEIQDISHEICDEEVQQEQMAQTGASNQDGHDMSSLASDLSNFDKIWNIGFPSLLPIDIDSHTCPPAI